MLYTPLPVNADVTPKKPEEQILDCDNHSRYRSLVGGLLYLSVSTRPDISFSVSALARQVHAPTKRHSAYLKRILRYIAGTISLGLNFPRSAGTLSPNSIAAHVDTDWGVCRETRRSTTGYVITINGPPILWRTRRQTIIALSSAQSEYIAMSDCAKHLSWTRKLFWEVAKKEPWHEEVKHKETSLATDSTAAKSLAENMNVSARGKHIDLRVHNVKELIRNKVIRLENVRSRENKADLLTKILELTTLRHLL